jgi:hypothetical protein
LTLLLGPKKLVKAKKEEPPAAEEEKTVAKPKRKN